MLLKAVVDRFEGEKAVLLLEQGKRQFVVPRRSLPTGTREGDWLQIELEAGNLVAASPDAEETGRVRQRIAEKLARLRRGEHRSPPNSDS